MDFHLEDLCGQAGPVTTGPLALPLAASFCRGLMNSLFFCCPGGNHSSDLSSNCPLLESEDRPVSTGRTVCAIPGVSCSSGILCDTSMRIHLMRIMFMLSINRHSCIQHKIGRAHRPNLCCLLKTHSFNYYVVVYSGKQMLRCNVFTCLASMQNKNKFLGNFK